MKTTLESIFIPFQFCNVKNYKFFKLEFSRIVTNKKKLIEIKKFKIDLLNYKKNYKINT